MSLLIDSVIGIEKNFAIEAFLLKEPEDSELTALVEISVGLCSLEPPQDEVLTGVARLSLRETTPGVMAIAPTPPGEDDQDIRLFVTQAIFGAAVLPGT